MVFLPKLVGILNLTPDSFSDGGQYPDAPAMCEAVARLCAEGAAVIDVGAESTRPGAIPLTAAAEWERLQPFMEEVLPRFSDTVFSLDTRHAENAVRGLRHGMRWINDVSGFSDVAMIEAVRGSDCRLVAMHSLSIPADPRVVMEQCDVISELRQWIRERIDTLHGYGISKERIIFDPGIGFGKTATQSLEILRRIGELRKESVELLVGHSRKSFLKPFAGAQDASRDAATRVVSLALADRGVEYLRVHDVAGHVHAFELWKALGDAA